MATHKVPQDVEAEDKLIGFLSLKQFIFTILGLGFGYLTFFFATKVNILVAFIWLPPMIVFFVLGLYQRKDQPTEVYLAAALRFYLKARKRKWDQEGYQERVIITAPPKIEHHYTKSFNSEEATTKLSSLSRMMDSRGWASKMSADWQNPQLAAAAASERLVQPADVPTQQGVAQAYMQPIDVMDENSSIIAQQVQTKLTQTVVDNRQRAIKVLQQARETSNESAAETIATEEIKYQSYPDMHQKIVSPQNTESEISINPPASVVEQTTPEPVVAPAPNTKVAGTNINPQTNEDGSVEIKLH
jgi:uncharacterized protein with FMN-binding domain